MGAKIAVLLVHSFAVGSDSANRMAFDAFLSTLGVAETPRIGTPVRIVAPATARE
jgi:hypothetical protein